MGLRTIAAALATAYALGLAAARPAEADETAWRGETVLAAAPDGVPIAVTVAGAASGPELLFVHSFLSSTLNWRPQFQSNLAETHKLAAVDIRGHGASGKPWTPETYADTQVLADDIATAIAAAEFSAPIIVTSTYGALFVMDYVRHYGTDKVAGLVIAGGDAGLNAPPPRTEPTGEAKARIERSRAANLFTIADWTRGFMDYLAQDGSLAPGDVELLLTSAMLAPHSTRRGMRDHPRDNTDLIDDLDIPVLFLAGEGDLTKDPSVADAAARLKQATVKAYDGVGMMLNWTSTERFNADVAAFAASVR